MSIDPNRLKHVFQGAVEIADRAARQAWLAQECGPDQELLAKVQALLKACDNPDSVIECLAPAPETQPWITAGKGTRPTIDPPRPKMSPGQHIGPYKLLQNLGEGGFGIVFMAEQESPVQRKVAVKVLKPGLDSAAVLARFEAERQALALMDHPNIARVFDGGLTDDGRSYFVMELIKGIPITKYCDQERLTPRERLELFIPVCHAVQHAHQKGIIHRDLKPSNVLIALYDGKPVPKVIDFGVAKVTGSKLTERTMFTEVGQIVGTLEYMAPEQAELNNLDIDTRADIYSLGVLLYELLTGSPPFTGKQLRSAAFDEMLRMIREVEPPKPSTRISTANNLPALAAARRLEPKKLATLMRGELDWVVMKCLQKERGRRYETANGLALELHRYLADEPVLAGPPTLRYRLGKLVARNKGTVAAVSIILFCLLAGILGTSVGLVWALRERDDKTKALSAETQAKEAAILAREAKEKALTAATKARAAEKQARDKALGALQAMTDEVVENQMARGTTLTEENKEFLRKIIKHFEGFATVTADDAASRAIRAEGHFRVGLMRHRLGELKEAEMAYADAMTIQKLLAADFPSRPEFRQMLAKSYHNLGILFNYSGRHREAEEAYADALAIFKQLAADFPSRPEFRQALGWSHDTLGAFLRDMGRLKEAESAFADALAIQKQLAADFPARPEFRQMLATSHANIGLLLQDMARPKEAEAAYVDALAIRKRLAADFPARPDYRQELAFSHHSLGKLLQDTGQSKEAEAAYADALAIQKQLAADFPIRPEFRRDLARSHEDLGALLLATKRFKEAEAACVDALAIRKQLAADFPNRPDVRQELASSHHSLGNLLRDTGRSKEAEAVLAHALAIGKQLAADFPIRPEFRRDLAWSHNDLGVLLHTMKRLKEAEAAYVDALAIRKRLAADFPARPGFRQELAASHLYLGSLLKETGRLREAEAAYADALAIFKRLAADFPTRPDYRQVLAASHNDLGVLVLPTGRLKEAEASFADALAIRKQLVADFPTQPDRRNDVAGTLVNFAVLYNQRRDFQSAKAYLEEALPHHQAALQANPRNATYRQFFLNNLQTLVPANAGLRDQAAALQAAQKLRDLGWDPPSNAYDAACALALSIPIVKRDEQRDAAQRRAAVQFYGDEAMKMLRDAVGKGWKDGAHTAKDSDLEPLRGREDFKKLLAELQGEKAKGKE